MDARRVRLGWMGGGDGAGVGLGPGSLFARPVTGGEGGGGRFGGNSPLLYFDVPAVMLGGSVAVPSEVLLPVGFPEAIVPPVIFHI